MTLWQKIEFAFFAFVLLAVTSCHALTPAQQAKNEKFDCQVRALEPLVSPTLDAAELARDLYLGKADMGRVLGSLSASKEEVQALLARIASCEPAALPEGEAQ